MASTLNTQIVLKRTKRRKDRGKESKSTNERDRKVQDGENVRVTDGERLGRRWVEGIERRTEICLVGV